MKNRIILILMCLTIFSINKSLYAQELSSSVKSMIGQCKNLEEFWIDFSDINIDPYTYYGEKTNRIFDQSKIEKIKKILTGSNLKNISLASNTNDLCGAESTYALIALYYTLDKEDLLQTNVDKLITQAENSNARAMFHLCDSAEKLHLPTKVVTKTCTHFVKQLESSNFKENPHFDNIISNLQRYYLIETQSLLCNKLNEFESLHASTCFDSLVELNFKIKNDPRLYARFSNTEEMKTLNNITIQQYLTVDQDEFSGYERYQLFKTLVILYHENSDMMGLETFCKNADSDKRREVCKNHMDDLLKRNL